MIAAHLQRSQGAQHQELEQVLVQQAPGLLQALPQGLVWEQALALPQQVQGPQEQVLQGLALLALGRRVLERSLGRKHVCELVQMQRWSLWGMVWAPRQDLLLS